MVKRCDLFILILLLTKPQVVFTWMLCLIFICYNFSFVSELCCCTCCQVSPEDKKAEKDRLKAITAVMKAHKHEAPNQQPPKVVKFGLNRVTALKAMLRYSSSLSLYLIVVDWFSLVGPRTPCRCFTGHSPSSSTCVVKTYVQRQFYGKNFLFLFFF